MLRNSIHGPIGFDEDGSLVLVDLPHSAIAPELPDEVTREAGRRVALWLLELLGPRATAAKLAGLRYAFHLERRSMEKVGREIGCGRAAISKWRALFADKFGLPAGRTKTQRAQRSQITSNAWQQNPRRGGQHGGLNQCKRTEGKNQT
jgi:hypothetical protein